MATRKPLVRISGKSSQLPAGDLIDAPGMRFAEGTTAPTVKDYGDRWLDTTSGIEYTWISPGVWVDLATAGIDFSTIVQTTGNQTIGGIKTFTSSPVVPGLNGGQLAGFRNKIINGNPGINQRGYVSGGATTAGQYTLDRWKVTGTGGVTFSTTANKTTVTIPSGQTLQQVVEGLNLESGTYVLSWEGTSQGRIAGGSYGASGAVTASITGGTDTTVEFNTGTVALVMLEKGAVATPFEHRPHGVELALCQRYYWRLFPDDANSFLCNGYAFSTTGSSPAVLFPVPMRVPPTSLEQSGTANQYALAYRSTTAVLSTVLTFFKSTSYSATVTATVASGLTAGDAVQLRTAFTGGAPAYLGFPAEL